MFRICLSIFLPVLLCIATKADLRFEGCLTLVLQKKVKSRVGLQELLEIEAHAEERAMIMIVFKNQWKLWSPRITCDEVGEDQKDLVHSYTQSHIELTWVM